MAITLTACGATNGASGSSTVIDSSSTGAADIPAGALILFQVACTSTIGPNGGSVADSAGNTYTGVGGSFLNSASANGSQRLFYAYNCAANALTGAGTITYTHPAGSSRAVISVAYATGIQTTSDPLDSSVTTTNASTNPVTDTVTSGSPAVSGELFIGLAANKSLVGYTQDTGNGWSNAMATQSSIVGSVEIFSGYQINAGTGTLTYAPVPTSLAAWADVIVGFKPVAVTAHRMFSVL